MTIKHLLTPLQLGDLTLPNRLVMAPLTRQRSLPGNVPGELNATYYAQRANAGLIISEAAALCMYRSSSEREYIGAAPLKL